MYSSKLAFVAINIPGDELSTSERVAPSASTSNEVTMTPLPEANDIPAYGRFKVADGGPGHHGGWQGLPDYSLCIHAEHPQGATGSNIILRLNTDMLGAVTMTDKNGVSKDLPRGVDLFRR